MAGEGMETRMCIAAVWEDDAEGLTADELAGRCNLHPAALEPYIRLGVVASEASTNRFPVWAVRRLRKAIRLRRDLGMNLATTGIVLDLLDRLESLQAELERLRAEVHRGAASPDRSGE